MTTPHGPQALPAGLATLRTADDAARAFAALQALAQARGVTLRPPPGPPTTCCGRGCNGCVWEGFYAAAHWWCEDAQAALAQPPAGVPVAPAA